MTTKTHKHLDSLDHNVCEYDSAWILGLSPQGQFLRTLMNDVMRNRDHMNNMPMFWVGIADN